MKQIKPILTIQDLSSFGRCSLAVVMPTISALGVQCCGVPTAVFSTHTGGFGQVARKDLDDFVAETLEHYRKLKLEFSAVYTGYLGSLVQFDCCEQYFKSFPKARHIIDPVMGDHGKAYSSFTPLMQQRMQGLIAYGELITPNLTETAILLGIEYPQQPIDQNTLLGYLRGLSTMTKGDIIITGVHLKGSDLLHNACYDRKKNLSFLVSVAPVQASFPGTGDLFTAVVAGMLSAEDHLEKAVITATAFTAQTVKKTHLAGTDPRCGVLLEQNLSALITKEFEILPQVTLLG